jgi:poly(3-hydroxyalkanoate) synthetase
MNALDNLKRLLTERDETLEHKGQYGGGMLYLAAVAVLPALIAAAELLQEASDYAHVLLPGIEGNRDLSWRIAAALEPLTTQQPKS